jgi:isopentenyl diphosphate isomerase/L-lactate dehydrogenase-like FMN-dependent dehydrogenase
MRRVPGRFEIVARRRPVRLVAPGFVQVHEEGPGTWAVPQPAPYVAATAVGAGEVVLGAGDAELAVEHGASAVLVSNHGGRQLDGAPSAISALPAVVDAVGGAETEVWIDGGIRSGQDVLRALALGARATLIGRAYAYGLGALGEKGVALALELIEKELDVTLALCGLRDVKDASPAILRSA